MKKTVQVFLLRRRARRLYHRCAKRVYKKRHRLSTAQVEVLIGDLTFLRRAMESHEALKEAIEQVESRGEWLRKSRWEIGRDFLGALVIALVVAIPVRQMWFENMQIPSGSMRPTYRELDRLIISKTPFGINVPMTSRHFYFDEELLRRADPFIFTAGGTQMEDQDTRLFGFPAKRRLIKRCMGLPGDTVYFYGGRLYGVDRDGRDISSELQDSVPEGVDHIPMIRFEGAVTAEGGAVHRWTLSHFHRPLGRVSIAGYGIRGEVWSKGWKSERLGSAYSDFYGIHHYAMARLLRGKEITDRSFVDTDHPLYLELHHHPYLEGEGQALVKTHRSFLPLEEAHIARLWEGMTTSRFTVRNGRAERFLKEGSPRGSIPTPHPIPNGCYEWIGGQAYRVTWDGRTISLPDDHPLCRPTLDHLQWLFNFGIEVDPIVDPKIERPVEVLPARYAYFRMGDLYVMGHRLMEQGESTLATFVKEEAGKKNASFIDRGPPVTASGALDETVISRFGLTIPEGAVLALGDNPPSSNDSRIFGLIPTKCIRGTPALLYWPPSSQWGFHSLTGRFATLPRLIVWGSVGLFGGGYLIARRSYRRRIDRFFSREEGIIKA